METMPVDFLQSLALVLIPAIISTGGTIYLGVRMMNLSRAQERIHADVAATRVEQKELASHVNGKMGELVDLAKTTSHAAGVLEGTAIKAEDIATVVAKVVEKTTADVLAKDRAVNGDHPI